MQKKLTFAQMAAGKIPSNPLAEGEVLGMNSERLQDHMQMFKLSDPRFITKEQALECGWKMEPNSIGIKLPYRNKADSSVTNVVLYNAMSVKGMPSISDMIRMSGEQIDNLRINAQETESELVIAPTTQQKIAFESVGEVAEPSTTEPAVQEYLAAHEYYKNGKHNEQGRLLAEEINEIILKRGLQYDEDAVKKVVSSYRSAESLGITVKSKSAIENDRIHQDDPARPKELLSGKLLRDEEGNYRTAFGRVAIKDSGTSLNIKMHDEDAYRAAMELAKLKGWEPVQLQGKPKQLAAAWLEAELLGIKVVGYQPTKEDKDKYAARLAKEQANKPIAPKGLEEGPDEVIASQAIMAVDNVKHCVTEGKFEGKILRVLGEFAEQKVGRDEADTVWHDISKLNAVPKAGAVVEICYKDGIGKITEKSLTKGRELAH